MTTQFRGLFTINIDHGYYDAQAGQVFDFVIPEDTAQSLRNLKMLARVRDGAIHLLFEADETGAGRIPAGGKRLRFGLRLTNPFFSNVTDLGGFGSGGAIPLYQNTGSTLSSPQKAILVGTLLNHPITRIERPVTVTLKGSTGQILQAEEITADQSRTAVVFDLTGRDVGVYTIEETYSGGTGSALYYSDAALLKTGISGVVEIGLHNDFYAVAPKFKITFKAKEETLKYYVVARNYTDAEFNQLSVTDTGFGADGRPEVRFTKVPSGALTVDDASPARLLEDSGGKLVLFKSIGKVARREKARRNIQLNKNGSVMVAHLPQPGIDRSNSDLYIHVFKP